MKHREPKEPVSDADFIRLHLLYLERKDPMRRGTPRVEKPIDVKPLHGGKIVTNAEYWEMVQAGTAKAPPNGY